MAQDSDTLQQLNNLVGAALKAGADAADAVDIKSIALSHAQRLGEVEKVERAESRDLGLRVFVGHKQAVASSTDPRDDALAELIERAIAMAKAVPDDEHCGLADPEQILTDAIPDLDIADTEEPSTETLAARARDCETAARSVIGVTNSEGAEASWSSSDVTIAASNGFSGGYRSTGQGFWVAVLAGEGTGMERDYEATSATYAVDLDSPEYVGQTAGARAVARLRPRKVETQKVPVVYAPRVSNGLVHHLAGAVNGSAVARGTSFLKDSMGERILPEGVHVIDDPHRKRGQRSKPFDAEGLPNGAMHLVEDGVLENWVLDLSTARKLGLQSNGRASRGTSSPPSPGTESLYAGGARFTRRTDRRHHRGFLRDRVDGIRHQQCNRRLQPRRLGFLDRERDHFLPRQRSDHRRQSERYVPQHDPGRRPALQIWHRCTDHPDRRHDCGGSW